MILHSDDPIAPVGYLKLNKLKLETKLPQVDLYSRLVDVPLKDSDGYITDQGEEASEFIVEGKFCLYSFYYSELIFKII